MDPVIQQELQLQRWPGRKSTRPPAAGRWSSWVSRTRYRVFFWSCVCLTGFSGFGCPRRLWSALAGEKKRVLNSWIGNCFTRGDGRRCLSMTATFTVCQWRLFFVGDRPLKRRSVDLENVPQTARRVRISWTFFLFLFLLLFVFNVVFRRAVTAVFLGHQMTISFLFFFNAKPDLSL